MTDAARSPSLTSRLLRHVTLPLVATWILGAAIAFWVGDSFIEQALDRSLLDDAYVVASRVRVQHDGLRLGLTQDELEAVLFDQTETMYFSVWHADGTLMAGDGALQPDRVRAAAVRYGFADRKHLGTTLRVVTLFRQQSPAFTVVIGETTASRRDLLRRLLALSIGPQLVLLFLLAWWLRRVIRREVRPLAALQQAVDQRDANVLTPVSAALAHHAPSRDVERLGSAVNALLKRVGDGIRARREFAGNVAHEMRTPLAGIRALAEYGLAHDDPQVQHEQLQAIVNSEARASHLVDQLLALAMADEGGDSVKIEPIELDAVVHETLLRTLPRADLAGVDLGATGLEHKVVVRANVSLVEAVLNNLIDNALRYGKADGRRPQVTVELATLEDETQGPSVTLSVIDNGPGLAVHERERLMQRWAQGHQATDERLGEGAGLGLAIVARYAELMRARFDVTEDRGSGGVRARLVFPAGAS